MSRKYVAVSFAVLLLAGGVGVAPALVTGEQGATAQTQQVTCNYERVFDRTIDSVVSVQTQAGQGSGFVVGVGGDETGANITVANATGDRRILANATYLVTNAHVVGDASAVTVQFNRGEYRTGEVVGRSAYADLAVVRVNDAPGYVEALHVASDDPQRGQAVAALGNPFGLEKTITQGIVSGVNRTMPTDMGFTVPDVVQTDAAINPGNSGGPLVACDGTVVGVNTAGIPSRRAENIGFAISASVVQEVVPELVETGAFDYPFLGVATRPVTPAVAQANDLDQTRGVIVVSTAEGGPTNGALQGSERFVTVDGTAVPVGGDIVLSVEGQEIRTGEDLATVLITQTEPGETVEVTLLRDGETRTVTVTVGTRPDPQTN